MKYILTLLSLLPLIGHSQNITNTNQPGYVVPVYGIVHYNKPVNDTPAWYWNVNEIKSYVAGVAPGSGVTSITAGAGLSGGTITTSGTISNKMHMQVLTITPDNTTTSWTTTVPAGDTICSITTEVVFAVDPLTNPIGFLTLPNCSISGTTLTIQMWEIPSGSSAYGAIQIADFSKISFNITTGVHY